MKKEVKDNRNRIRLNKSEFIKNYRIPTKTSNKIERRNCGSLLYTSGRIRRKEKSDINRNKRATQNRKTRNRKIDHSSKKSETKEKSLFWSKCKIKHKKEETPNTDK